MAASFCVANSANIVRAHNAGLVHQALIVADAIYPKTARTLESLDREARKVRMVLSGVHFLPGGYEALTLYVKDLLRRHAGLPEEALAAVQCFRFKKKSNAANLIVHFGTVQDKQAAFQAASVLRQQNIHMNDDLTQVQMVNRKALFSARDAYRQAGLPAWFHRGVLHYSKDGAVYQHQQPSPGAGDSSSQSSPPHPQSSPGTQDAAHIDSDHHHPSCRPPGVKE